MIYIEDIGYEIASDNKLCYGYNEFTLRMKNDHEKCLHVRIPDSVYAPLAEKLEKLKDGEKIGNKMFQLSIKTIVDGTNRIQKNRKPRREAIKWISI